MGKLLLPPLPTIAVDILINRGLNSRGAERRTISVRSCVTLLMQRTADGRQLVLACGAAGADSDSVPVGRWASCFLSHGCSCWPSPATERHCSAILTQPCRRRMTHVVM